MSLYVKGSAIVRHGGEKTDPNVRLIGMDDYYLDINGQSIEHGRGFSGQELESGAARAIIGNELLNKLFNGNVNRALEGVIRVDNLKCKIIGILESKGASMNQSADRVVYIPVQTARNYFGNAGHNYDLAVGVYNAIDMDDAISEATGTFRNVHNYVPHRIMILRSVKAMESSIS